MSDRLRKKRKFLDESDDKGHTVVPVSPKRSPSPNSPTENSRTQKDKQQSDTQAGKTEPDAKEADDANQGEPDANEGEPDAAMREADGAMRDVDAKRCHYPNKEGVYANGDIDPPFLYGRKRTEGGVRASKWILNRWKSMMCSCRKDSDKFVIDYVSVTRFLQDCHEMVQDDEGLTAAERAARKE